MKEIKAETRESYNCSRYITDEKEELNGLTDIQQIDKICDFLKIDRWDYFHIIYQEKYQRYFIQYGYCSF